MQGEVGACFLLSFQEFPEGKQTQVLFKWLFVIFPHLLTPLWDKTHCTHLLLRKTPRLIKQHTQELQTDLSQEIDGEGSVEPSKAALPYAAQPWPAAKPDYGRESISHLPPPALSWKLTAVSGLNPVLL